MGAGRNKSFFILLLAGALLGAPRAYAQVLVAVVGDSNVAGTAVASGERYPAQLERALKAKGLDVRVHNGGQNGDTTSGLLGRLSSAAPEGTKVAVVWIGVNDRRRGASDGEIQAGRQRVVAALKARGIEVYAVGPSVYSMELHKNPKHTVADGHFNAAGYAMMVGRTLGSVQALVTRAKK